MRPPRIRVAHGLLALLVGLALWRLGMFAPVPESAGPEFTQAPTSDHPATEGVLKEPIEADAPSDASRREAVAATPTAVEEPATHELRGRVIVVASDGREIGDADGRLSLGVWQGELGTSHDVAFTGGAWSLSIQASAPYFGISVDGATVGGRWASVEEPTGQRWSRFHAELVVRVRLAPSSILHVVDAGNGLHLAGVCLVPAPPGPLEDSVHPGPDFERRAVAKDLLSPIALDEHAAGLEGHVMRLLVGAPGHAWERVEVDLLVGGGRVLALARGADLSVSVRGADPAAHALLRLRGAERFSPFVEVPLERDGNLEFLGLPTGECRVVAEVGKYFDSPLVLGEVTVALRAGERTRADLVLKAPPVLELAPAGGVVHVPQAWGSDDVIVSLSLLDTPLGGFEAYQFFQATPVASRREGCDAFRWFRTGMQVGHYELEVREPPYSIVVDLPPGGRDDLDVVVPPPAELVVNVVDDLSGEEVLTDRLLWHTPFHHGIYGGALRLGNSGGGGNARRHPQGHGYLIRAPAIEIVLWLSTREYQRYDATVDLGRGVREHTIRLQRKCGISLRMVDGEAPIAFPADWDGKPTAVEGSGQVTGTGYSDFERTFSVTGPGTYSILPPAIPGYRPPAARTIEVFPGRFSEHVVELVREH